MEYIMDIDIIRKEFEKANIRGITNIIGITNIGSHMWRMNHKDSDIDLGMIYTNSTTDILRGTARKDSKQIENGNDDWTIHEIEKVVEMLMKGNVNYVWITTSPIILYETKYSKELRKIYMNNISANIYHSIRGLAIHNYKKYLVGGYYTEGESIQAVHKKRKIIVRSLKFGINLLNERQLLYEPVTEELTDKIVLQYIDELEEAYKNTTLQEKPDEEVYRRFLEKVRRELDEVI